MKLSICSIRRFPSIFLVVLAVCVALFPGRSIAQIDSSTVNNRLQAKLQENVDDAWPGVSNPSNAAGVFSYALACLYLDQNVAQANQLLFDFYTNNPIPPKGGGRDEWNGYFWQHILWRIYHDPTSASRMTTQTRELIEDNMWRWLESRSKISEAEQNVWMIYDSENHDAMTKGSHLMCLVALKNSPRYGADITFPDGGTLAEHLSAWTAFYMRYFRARAQEGMHVEIASPIYAKYTMGAYYNIMDFADSADLREMARKVVDLYWADTASDWVASGVRAGGSTRTPKDSYVRNGTSYSFHGLMWCYGWHDNEAGIRTYPMIQAVSPYRVPDSITACATDPNRPSFLYTSRRFGRGGAWDGNQNYTVVFDNGDSSIRRETWVTPDYAMGSITHDMNKSYIALYDQSRCMSVMFSSGVNDRISVFAEGKDSDGKSFSALSGVTRENCMVVQRDKNGTPTDKGTLIFIPTALYDTRVESGGWLFVQAGNAYCAVRPAGGGYTASAAQSGYDLKLGDKWAPVIVQTGQAGDYADFADFQTSVIANALSYSAGTMNYTSEAGDVFTFYANSKTTPRVNGSTVNLNPAKTYDSPYLSMTHGADIATFSYTGYPDLVLDFGYDPDISSLSPANTATGVSVGTAFAVTFNEPIQAGSGFIRLWKTADNSLVESFDVTDGSRVTISGAVVTFQPSTVLELDTGYYLTMDATAFDDLQGNSFAGLSLAMDWSFTTPSARAISPVNSGSRTIASQLGNSSATYSFNAGANAEMLLVAISTERSGEVLYSVRYDGNDLEMAVESGQAGIWYLDLRSTTYTGGAADLVVDFSGVATVNGVAVGAVSVEANDYDIELHATATGTESSDLITTRNETFNLVSFNANGSGSPTVNSPLTTIYADGDIGSAQGAAGYQSSASAGTNTYTWSTGEKRKVVGAAFVVANSYANWASDFDLGGLTGQLDDPDLDLLPNAVEAWLGTHPGKASSGLDFQSTNGIHTTVSHPVSQNPPDDLQLDYMWSSNLDDWYYCDGVDGPTTGEKVVATPGGSGQTVTVSLTANEIFECLFIRLGVTPKQ